MYSNRTMPLFHSWSLFITLYTTLLHLMIHSNDDVFVTGFIVQRKLGPYSVVGTITTGGSMVKHVMVPVCMNSNNNNESDDDDDNNKGGFMGGVRNFFQELDNFMDDASARRLGNGAAFYGKRKSNFYGKDDKNKKSNAKRADPIEDYQAPNTGGYFQWITDEQGNLKPVTRMKKTIVERNPNYWDRVFTKDDQEK